MIEQFKHGLPASDERNTLSDMSHEQLADEESMTLTSNLEFARRDLGEMTDKKSLAKYRAELKEIEAELDRLPPDSPERPMVEADKEKLLQHLNSVLKLGGEIRTFDGPKEQARKNVSRAIKLAIKKIQREFPVLAACLDSAVKRGTECCYNPPNLPS
ncbi:MAG: hypothetical protein IH884_09445 [Myxococcales bacterium]|nr:hypothetical protein [Myxococcales bacterium]